MDPRKARSACSIAFWQQHGMRPRVADATGLDPDSDLTEAARSAAAALSEADDYAVKRTELRELAAANPDDYGARPVPDETPREMREVLVMTPGTYGWAEHTWTLADLQEIARNFDAGDPPPVQLDHSYSARDTVGYVRGLRLQGEALYALAEFIGSEAVERVRTGLYRKVSAGLLIQPIQALRELSVTPFPAVAHAAIKKEEIDMAIGATPAPSATPPAAATAQAATLSTTPAPAAPEQPAAAPLAVDQTSVELRATLEAQQARIAQLEAQQAEQAKLARQAQDNADYIELCQAGKTVSAPEVKALELKILGSLTAEQRPDYLALRKALPNAWPTGRTVTADLSRDGSTRAAEDEEAKRLSARLNPPADSAKLTSASK